MTNPELDPKEALKLQLQKELRQGFCSPIEEEAIEFLQEISSRIQDRELELRATQFATNLVGWRSSDADPMTGRVVIGMFDLNEESGRTIDHFGQLFLTRSKSVQPVLVVGEAVESVTEYTYEQFRKNGKVRNVSIRRQPVNDAGTMIEYSVGYIDIGEHSGGSELLLDLGRMSLLRTGLPELSGDAWDVADGNEAADPSKPQKRRFHKFLG